ncbi:MAG TPA: type II secretion system F family protein [Terriglobia bacterium]|nr:type II secretion system F family protein [Terriglobia bacterium]
MTFLYKAVNAQGKFSEGRLDAADKRAAVSQLESMGLIPVTIDQPLQGRTSVLPKIQLRGISRRDILFFTEQLATLIHAGLPLDRALTITAETAQKPAFRAVVESVLKQIKGGKSLAEALASHPKQFSRLYVNMIRAGEAGGVLDPILARLVEFEQAADEMRGYLISSLIYPCLLASVGIGSIGILLYFVIPKFGAIFADAGAAIPAGTLALMWFSDVTRAYWWIVVAILAAIVVAVRVWMKSPTGSRQWDAIRIRLPLLGPTLLKIEVARFARTLGTLTASAVPLIAAVRIVQQVVRNQIIAEAIAKIADGAKRGEGVARPMRETAVFPDLAVHLVEVGEETGRIDTMLLQIADAYDKDVRTSVKALTSVFEPAVILVMGVIIGAVILSILTAIFSINDAVGF